MRKHEVAWTLLCWLTFPIWWSFFIAKDTIYSWRLKSKRKNRKMGKLVFENAVASDVPEEIYDQIFRESLHRDETLHVYKNELAECGWSFTKFAVGDRVKILGLKHIDSTDDPKGVIVSISPATYGMLNICVRKDDGTETLSYPGDIEKLEPNR